MLPGLSVGGMVWQRLSFATAASDMGTKRDQTQASDNAVVNLMGLGVLFFCGGTGQMDAFGAN